MNYKRVSVFFSIISNLHKLGRDNACVNQFHSKKMTESRLKKSFIIIIIFEKQCERLMKLQIDNNLFIKFLMNIIRYITLSLGKMTFFL